MAGQNAFPLSCEQRDYLNRGNTGFGTIAACAEIAGPLDLNALADAVQYVRRRHEPLRMQLWRGPGGTGQIFLDPDLTDIRWTLRSVASRHEVFRHAAEKIDPERDGPLALKFLRSADGGPAHLIALLDHLACDGWGSYLFLQELWENYRLITRGQLPDPEVPKFPYSRYILDQQKLAARRSGSVRSDWQARVHRFAWSDTGLRRAGPVAEGAGKADVSAAIEPRHVAQAKQLASSLGLSPNIIPLGCVVLAAWSLGEADSVGLSLIYAGRDNPRTRFMLGLLRRYVCVVAEQIPQDTLASFLTGLSKAVFEGIRLSRPPYLAYEFEEAVNDCRREPVVDVLYNQVDQLFGAAQPDRVQQLDDLTTVKIVDDPHFSPDRWRAFREPRLRLVLGGGDQPRLQAIFNAGSVAEDEVRQLVGRAVAIAGVMSPETRGSRIPEIVRSAFAEVAH